LPSGIRVTTDRPSPDLWAIRGQSVIVDANLFLLLAVGLHDPRAIKNMKRLSNFTVDDFELLRAFLNSSSRLVTTAHVLTEVSNLAGSTSGHLKDMIFVQLSSLIEIFEEKTSPAKEICRQIEFQRFGLTDAALSQLLPGAVLLTEDGRLAHYLQSKSLRAMTLSDVRHLRRSSHAR
jgi:rRNA-processing protein FCF1